MKRIYQGGVASFLFLPSCFRYYSFISFYTHCQGHVCSFDSNHWMDSMACMQQFYASAFPGINFPRLPGKVSEGEKALARSSPEMGWHQQYLSLSFQDYDVQLYMCEARGAGNVLHSINICAGCSARHCGRCKDDCDTVPDLKVLLV